ARRRGGQGRGRGRRGGGGVRAARFQAAAGRRGAARSGRRDAARDVGAAGAARGRLVLRALLRRWFLENAALKVVALGLAVTLFILVRGEKETERAVRVGLAYIKPTDRVLVTDVPDSMDVWVRGPWTRIKRLDPAEVDPVVVDLTKVADGDIVLDERSI